MSIDATCVPVNITYPTDLKLLSVVGEKIEELIDELYEDSGLELKPRTYSDKARAEYLSYAKKKRMSRNDRFTGNSTILWTLKRR